MACFETPLKQGAFLNHALAKIREMFLFTSLDVPDRDAAGTRAFLGYKRCPFTPPPPSSSGYNRQRPVCKRTWPCIRRPRPTSIAYSRETRRGDDIKQRTHALQNVVFHTVGNPHARRHSNSRKRMVGVERVLLRRPPRSPIIVMSLCLRSRL